MTANGPSKQVLPFPFIKKVGCTWQVLLYGSVLVGGIIPCGELSKRILEEDSVSSKTLEEVHWDSMSDCHSGQNGIW